VLYQAGLYERFAGQELARFVALPEAQRDALADELNRRVASLADVGLSDTRSVVEGVTRAIEGSTPAI
jgi:hypothetical protein